MSGANSFEDMAIWMKERKREISKFLRLEPSKTFFFG
jgi:hypothetical protein